MKIPENFGRIYNLNHVQLAFFCFLFFFLDNQMLVLRPIMIDFYGFVNSVPFCFGFFFCSGYLRCEQNPELH